MGVSNRLGFTLTEIMIVISIIGILAMIGFPIYINFIKSSQKTTCIANLKLLESAIEELKFTGESSITKETLIGDEKFVRAEPVCPTEKKPYTNLNPPTCPSLPGEHFIAD